MDNKKAICDYLRKYHKGRQKAVHSKELEDRFSIKGRDLRRVISALRQDGIAICSNEKGYYFAENQKEINATVSRLNELVTKISNARTGLLYASVLTDGVPIEITVKIGTRGGMKYAE